MPQGHALRRGLGVHRRYVLEGHDDALELVQRRVVCAGRVGHRLRGHAVDAETLLRIDREHLIAVFQRQRAVGEGQPRLAALEHVES